MRIRVPSTIKAGEIVKVRTLVIHPMEIVEREGRQARRQEVPLHHQGGRHVPREAGRAVRDHQSISENPFFAFAFTATDPGQLRVTFLDTHGGKYEGTADIKFAERAGSRRAPALALLVWRSLARRAGLRRGAGDAAERPTPRRPAWTSRAIPEARGDVRTLPDGKREAVRYPGWTTQDFGAFRTYAYGDARPEPPVQRATLPAGRRGDPKKGRALFLSRAKGPCTGCHLVPGDDVWPAGSVGPDLSTYRRPQASATSTSTCTSTIRASLFPQTIDAAVGRGGRAHARGDRRTSSAFLQTLEGPGAAGEGRRAQPVHARAGPSASATTSIRPTTRRCCWPRAPSALWSERGPARQGVRRLPRRRPDAAMKGVATRYPRFVTKYGRVMSHRGLPRPCTGPRRRGARFPRRARQPRHGDADQDGVQRHAGAVDLASPETRGRARPRARRRSTSAWASATTRAPTATRRRRAADKFLGGRLLADVERRAHPPLPDVAHEPEPTCGTCASACSGA